MDFIENLIDSAVGRAIWRFLRAEVSLMISLYLANLLQRPEIIALAPVILAVSKYLRDQFNLDLKII
jgi:hypothetical protein